MSEVHRHPVPPQWAESAHIDNEKYLQMYAESVQNPEQFWAEQG